jgi:hypothetical protein
LSVVLVAIFVGQMLFVGQMVITCVGQMLKQFVAFASSPSFLSDHLATTRSYQQRKHGSDFNTRLMEQDLKGQEGH